jgi:hypothetical protein
MGVTRTRLAFERAFTRIPNDWARDEKLSRRARGLLVEIMSHRVGWRVTVAGLVKTGPEGRDAIATALGELIRAGYLIRSQSRKDGGTFAEVEYELQDPANLPATANGFPGSGDDDSEGPAEELSTGPTAPWETVDGSAVSGSPAHGESAPIEEHLEEDQGEEERAAAPTTPFCSRHPQGTDRPCRACQQARLAFDASQVAARPVPIRRYDPAVYCEHLQLRTSECDACTQDARSAARAIAAG